MASSAQTVQIIWLDEGGDSPPCLAPSEYIASSQLQRLGMPLVKTVYAPLAGASFSSSMRAGRADGICCRYYLQRHLVASYTAQATVDDLAHI